MYHLTGLKKKKVLFKNFWYGTVESELRGWGRFRWLRFNKGVPKEDSESARTSYRNPSTALARTNVCHSNGINLNILLLLLS